jgi:hypothetical protein
MHKAAPPAAIISGVISNLVRVPACPAADAYQIGKITLDIVTLFG